MNDVAILGWWAFGVRFESCGDCEQRCETEQEEGSDKRLQLERDVTSETEKRSAGE
jgi:hypothetical protein